MYKKCMSHVIVDTQTVHIYDINLTCNIFNNSHQSEQEYIYKYLHLEVERPMIEYLLSHQ